MINVGDNLLLQLEPDNDYDKNAVAIYDDSNHKLGYIPRYYSESVTNRINKQMTYSCVVIEVNKEIECTECVKVKLCMPKRQ